MEFCVVRCPGIFTEQPQRLAHMIEDNNGELIVPDEWPEALGSATWVEEVWTNYVSNALKYGGRSPRVELGATPTEDGKDVFFT